MFFFVIPPSSTTASEDNAKVDNINNQANLIATPSDTEPASPLPVPTNVDTNPPVSPTSSPPNSPPNIPPNIPPNSPPSSTTSDVSDPTIVSQSEPITIEPTLPVPIEPTIAATPTLPPVETATSSTIDLPTGFALAPDLSAKLGIPSSGIYDEQYFSANSVSNIGSNLNQSLSPYLLAGVALSVALLASLFAVFLRRVYVNACKTRLHVSNHRRISSTLREKPPNLNTGSFAFSQHLLVSQTEVRSLLSHGYYTPGRYVPGLPSSTASTTAAAAAAAASIGVENVALEKKDEYYEVEPLNFSPFCEGRFIDIVNN